MMEEPRSERVAYWKSFVVALLWETLKRGTIYSLLFAGLFFLVAVLIYQLAITPEVETAYQILIAPMFILYPVAGAICGGIYAVNSTLTKKIGDIEGAMRRMTEPLVAGVIERMSVGPANITIDRFKLIVDELLAKMSGATRSESRLFFPARVVYGFFVSRALRAFRLTLVEEFLGGLKAKGETHVTVRNVQEFAIDKIVQTAADDLRRQVSLSQAVVYAVSALLWLGPFVAMLIWR